jgi:predicted NAD-dependent protein-ADP-ribosyltransferase YbiA (DUF1768 family)
MVYSNINGTVFYKETRDIDQEDVGYESTLYELNIHNKYILITFGKIKHTFINRDIVYYPIYLVANDTIKSQIGVIEIPKNRTLEFTDDDGDLNVEHLPPPLYYSFVNDTYIDRNGTDSDIFMKNVEKQNEDDNIEIEDDDDVVSDTEFDELDEVLTVNVKSSNLSKESEKATQILNNGVFTIDPNIKIPSELAEETETDAKQHKKEFKTSVRTTWIEKFMKNNNYDIHNVETNGDCFFAVIRDAFKQIGHITTVSKLRAILAKEVTDTIFQEHRTLFNDVDGTIREYERELKGIKHTLQHVLKKRAENARDNKLELRKILDETARMKEEYKRIVKDKQSAQSIISENVGNISSIDTLEKFREYIQTSSYWADSWGVSVLERVLQIKMIILSQRAYLEEDLNGVIMCGEVDTIIQREGTFRPKHYIITSFSGDHFNLITYKNKRIFAFHEIPYHIKSLIINKCMERASGSFYIIPEVRDLKARMGIDEDEGKPKDSDDETIVEYNNKIVFEYHSKSAKTPKPGKGSNEKIPADKRSTFLDLSRFVDWRKKLDDSWADNVFELDNHKWASVEHYYQSSKFKKRNPDFAALFSIDKSSEFSHDVDLAKSAGSRSGNAVGKAKTKIKGDVLLRPKNIAIDPDFYGERSQNERLLAVSAKFTQNSDLNQILLATRDAKLMNYHQGAPSEPDHTLMAVRRELQS